MHDVLYQSAHSLVHEYRLGNLSPVEVIDAVLTRADVLEPELCAFQLLDHDAARQSALASEARWLRGEPCGRLDGVPVSIKDIVLTRGWPTLSGSKTTDATGPWEEDCPAVASLRASGCVLFGKTTTPEFGWMGMTDSPLSGVTRNPWKLAHTPGGSSGGAAAAVAAGIGPLALGTDGGGSIRIPASHCGLYGFKPTFGRVPNYPTSSPFSTVTSAGPIGRCVADVALMTKAIARLDRRDWYGLPDPKVDYTEVIDDGVAGLKVALSLDLGGAEVEPQIDAAVRQAAHALGSLGAKVIDVGPVIEPLRQRFENKWLLGFAHRLRSIPVDRWDELDPRFLILAQRGLSLDLAEYLAGETATIHLGEQLGRLHDEYDVLLTPTMPVVAPLTNLPYASQGNDRWRHGVPFTLPFNLTGQPAASVPVGITSEGLPIGAQVVAAKYEEVLVLRVARALERTVGLDWASPLFRSQMQINGSEIA
ncbi:MAG: aspartyl-tRNA(Asn)/glutamyl-tRNA(Gln) amidotransferase subunit A [Gammaproteobacteria bacterium]|jgi:aspartyl-tRNA(Asn)/glutamyl-tRNA(Gln) amidotransferase subunit A